MVMASSARNADSAQQSGDVPEQCVVHERTQLWKSMRSVKCRKKTKHFPDGEVARAELNDRPVQMWTA